MIFSTLQAEIPELEEELDRRLPAFRLEGRPSTEQLSAADRWSKAVWATAEEAGPYPLDSADLQLGLCLAERPVFVCGAHRSGTTLVRDLLDGHPQLSVLPSEGSFLTSLRGKIEALPRAEKLGFLGREWLCRLANPINQAPYWLLDRTTDSHSPYVRFARMLLAWGPLVEGHFERKKALSPHIAIALSYAACPGAPGIRPTLQRWVDKTPTNEFHLDRLWSELPAAKIIHIVRDPVAVYSSRKRLEERMLGSFATAKSVLEEIAHSLEIAVQNGSRDGRQDYLLVRYEDLTTKPEEIMGQIASFLEIELAPALFCPTVATMPSYPNSSFPQRGEAGSLFSDANGDRSGNLTDREQELVAAYTGDFAEALGYPRKPLAVHRKWLLKASLRLSGTG
ncbi:MAG TPA: sulfotransferase [Chthonomonadaceae bacterium]|nr:sulfotransferase [Chthonomonadaceae bacterium]